MTDDCLGQKLDLMDIAGYSASDSPQISEDKASGQSLIGLLTGLLHDDAAEVVLSRTQALSLVDHLRGMDAKVRHFEVRERELEEKVKTFEATSRLGDYVGKIFNDLKATTDSDSKTSLTGRADEVVAEMDCPFTKKDITKALRAAVAKINEHQRLTNGIAKFSIREYAKRNHVAHSTMSQFAVAKDWESFKTQILNDLDGLDGYLPDAWQKDCEKWRAVITYFRDRHLVCREGVWHRREEAGQTEHPFDTERRQEGLVTTRKAEIANDLVNVAVLGDMAKLKGSQRRAFRSDQTPHGDDDHEIPTWEDVRTGKFKKRMAEKPLLEEESPAKKRRTAEADLFAKVKSSKHQIHRELKLRLLDLVDESLGLRGETATNLLKEWMADTCALNELHIASTLGTDSQNANSEVRGEVTNTQASSSNMMDTEMDVDD